MLDNEIVEGNEPVEGSNEEVVSEAEGAEVSVEGEEGGSIGDMAQKMAEEMTKGGGKDAPKKDESKADKAIKEQIRKFKLKIDGKEEELDEAEVLKRAQLASGAQKRMQEAAQLRKDVEQLIEALRTNPLELLTNPALGIDIKKVFEDYASRQLEEATKTPEQKEREKLQKELEDLRKQAQSEKEAREKAEFERLKEKAALDLDEQMTAACENAGLPKSPYVIKRMADYMILAAENGVKVAPMDVLPIVKREMQEDLKQFFASSPDDLVEELLSKERISNFRKKALAAAKKPVETANSIKSTGNSSSAEVQEKKSEGKKQTISSWLRNF